MRKKAILLVPLRYNDGTLVPKKVINDFLADIYVIAGGHHLAGRGKGAYRMASGKKQVDVTLEVWVALEESLVPDLKALVKRYCSILGQESMYFEMTSSEVQFLEPNGGSHDKDE